MFPDLSRNLFRTEKSLLVGLMTVAMAAAAIAYLPSFQVPFTFDDIPNLVHNQRIHAEHPRDLVDALDPRPGERDRTTAMMTFALNHLFGGLNTFGYHLVNLLIHLVNTVLIMTLVYQLGMRPERADKELEPAAARQCVYLAFTGALLWALHPVNTQAVTYIVQRMTSLATMFYLLALLLFVLWRRQRIGGMAAALGVIACFFLGMTSKSIVATLPAAIWLLDVVLLRRWSRLHFWALPAIGMLAAGLIGYYAWRDVLDFMEPLHRRDFTGYERVLTEGRVLWHYLGLLAWPDPDRLQLDYEFAKSTGWLSPVTTLLGWGAITGLAVLAWRVRDRHPWPAFAWLFFLLASSIEASFLSLELVFEHRIYLPAGFLGVALMAPLVERLRWRQLRWGVLVVACVLALGTIERNRQWANIAGFWADELRQGAKPARAGLNAAKRYNRLGQPEMTLSITERVMKDLPPHHAVLLAVQRAEALAATNRVEEGVALLEGYGVGERYPEPRAVYNLGSLYVQSGRIEQAERMLEILAGVAPDGMFTAALRASILQGRGDAESAVESLNIFLERRSLSPHDEALARFHLANAHLALDQVDAAYREYRRIVTRVPDHWAAWGRIHQMLVAAGDNEQAARVARYLRNNGVNPEAWQ